MLDENRRLRAANKELRLGALGLPRSFAQRETARYSRELKNPYPVTVEKTLGRPARSYAEWVVDHTSAFQSSPAA